MVANGCKHNGKVFKKWLLGKYIADILGAWEFENDVHCALYFNEFRHALHRQSNKNVKKQQGHGHLKIGGRSVWFSDECRIGIPRQSKTHNDALNLHMPIISQWGAFL